MINSISHSAPYSTLGVYTRSSGELILGILPSDKPKKTSGSFFLQSALSSSQCDSPLFCRPQRCHSEPRPSRAPREAERGSWDREMLLLGRVKVWRTGLVREETQDPRLPSLMHLPVVQSGGEGRGVGRILAHVTVRIAELAELLHSLPSHLPQELFLSRFALVSPTKAIGYRGSSREILQEKMQAVQACYQKSLTRVKEFFQAHLIQARLKARLEDPKLFSSCPSSSFPPSPNSISNDLGAPEASRALEKLREDFSTKKLYETIQAQEYTLKGLGLSRLPNLSDLFHLLTTLHLSHNLLSYLPQLPATLQQLHLEGNRFSVIPAAVFDLHDLRLLDLSRNPLDCNAFSEQITSIAYRIESLRARTLRWEELYFDHCEVDGALFLQYAITPYLKKLSIPHAKINKSRLAKLFLRFDETQEAIALPSLRLPKEVTKFDLLQQCWNQMKHSCSNSQPYCQGAFPLLEQNIEALNAHEGFSLWMDTIFKVLTFQHVGDRSLFEFVANLLFLRTHFQGPLASEAPLLFDFASCRSTLDCLLLYLEIDRARSFKSDLLEEKNAHRLQEELSEKSTRALRASYLLDFLRDHALTQELKGLLGTSLPQGLPFEQLPRASLSYSCEFLADALLYIGYERTPDLLQYNIKRNFERCLVQEGKVSRAILTRLECWHDSLRTMKQIVSSKDRLARALRRLSSSELMHCSIATVASWFHLRLQLEDPSIEGLILSLENAKRIYEEERDRLESYIPSIGSGNSLHEADCFAQNVCHPFPMDMD